MLKNAKISNLVSSNGCIFLNSFLEVAAVSNSPNVVLECTFKCEINGLVALQKKIEIEKYILHLEQILG